MKTSPARGAGDSPAAGRRKFAAPATAVLLAVKPLVFVFCLVPAGQIVWSVYQIVTGATGGALTALGANPITEIEIQTGLWTMRFLAITLAVTPIRELTNVGALAKYRRMLGLFTFFYACLHVSTWVGVDWFFDWSAMAGELVKRKFIFVGMATFLLLVPLALTSTKGWVRRLGGKRWARLHRLVYVAAITATVHYLWAVKKDTFFPLVYFALFAVLLGYRAIPFIRQRMSRQRPLLAPSEPRMARRTRGT